MYADDTAVVVADNDINTLEIRVREVIQQFQDWCFTNHLVINANKTKIIEFTGKYREPENLSFSVLDIIILNSSQANFLGLTVDNALAWEDQVDKVCKRINCSYFALLTLKGILDKTNLLKAYYSLVYPFISYCIASWGRAVNINRVFIGQKRIIRLIFGLGSTETCRNVMREYKILTVCSVYLLKILTYIHKIRQRFTIASDVHGHDTRNKGLICLEKFHHTYHKTSPHHAGIDLYNKLPRSLKGLESSRLFSNQLKKILQKQVFYSIQEFLDFCSDKEVS